MNEKAKQWAITSEGKALQTRIFKFLYNYRKEQLKFSYTMFDTVAVDYLKVKSGLLNNENYYWAIENLEEIGYLKGAYYGRGKDIKLTKKGIKAWEKMVNK